MHNATVVTVSATELHQILFRLGLLWAAYSALLRPPGFKGPTTNDRKGKQREGEREGENEVFHHHSYSFRTAFTDLNLY